MVNTSKGSVSVLVCGDQGKPALITYPDVALNCMILFLFFCFLPMIYLDLKLNACSGGSWNGYFSFILIPNVWKKVEFSVSGCSLLLGVRCLCSYKQKTLSTDMSCFQGLLFCSDAASLLLHNFCIYHIDAPGHEVRYMHPISSALDIFFIFKVC